jgi:mannose-6-phosphate isomerase-like protein (cupin superfamily)
MSEPQPMITDRVSICRADQGEPRWAMGSLFELLVGAESTGGGLGAALVTQPPGLATPTHIHTRESEAWFVLDGTVTYRAGSDLVMLGKGDFIYLPSGVPHAFRVTGSRPIRYLALAFPGDLLDIYTEIGVPATERRLPDGGIPPADVDAWLRLAPSFGLQVVGPPIPEQPEADVMGGRSR